MAPKNKKRPSEHGSRKIKTVKYALRGLCLLALVAGAFLLYPRLNISWRPAELAIWFKGAGEGWQGKPVALKLAGKDCQVGGEVILGSYWVCSSRVREPLVWQVLALEDSKVMLITRDIVDWRPYNDAPTAKWEESELRGWLNSYFLSTAFTSAERERLVLSRQKEEGNPRWHFAPGNSVEDRIFLLDEKQLLDLWPEPAQRLASPTPYAVAHGCRTYDNGKSWWWIRTLGSIVEKCECVYFFGNINEDHTCALDGGVRPVIWLKTSASAEE